MVSDLAWSPTHTLINPLTEVVDYQQRVESSLPALGLRFRGEWCRQMVLTSRECVPKK
jgi:hypothetical protein